MSSPQHPTGSGPQPWHDQHPQNPGAGSQPQYGQGPAYGPGPYGSGGPDPYGSGGPGPYGSAPGPYGSAPAPGPYGPGGPGPYGSAPGPGPYGSAPGPHGSAPGPYGSAPGQFGSAGPPAQHRPSSGPGLLGPLTLRDLFLLFAGLLSLVVLFVPYMSDGFVPWSLWHWGIDTMGTLVFNVFAIWLIVAAVFVNKFGNGRVRIGSLSLDQSISALSGAAFTYAFVHLLTTVQFWHVGAYLAFFAALVAFFAGVFTMIPFFGKEFAIRDEVAAHPKARPVSKGAPHPAPVANMPGPSNGPGGYGAPYGGQPGVPIGSQNQPGGYGQPGHPGAPGQYGQPGHPGAPGQYGQQGQPEQFADSGQAGRAGEFPGSGQHAGPGQPGQYAGSGQPTAPAQQFTQPGYNGQPDGQDQFGQPIGSEQNSPYAPPQQHAQESSSGSAPNAGDSSDQAVQSTGSGQSYLGAQHSEAPQHTQSEPTQTFGFGAHREESPSNNDGETAVQAPVPADADSSSAESAADADRGPSVDGATDTVNSTDTSSSGDHSDDDSSGAGAGAAAGAGALGVGAAVAGAAAASSESDRPRGRHAAAEADTDAEAADGDGDQAAESSSFATKVNGHDSDTNVRASEGVALKPESNIDGAQEASHDSESVEHSEDLTATGGSTTDTTATGSSSAVSGSRDEDEALGVGGATVTGDSQNAADRAAQPEAEEPTQYVPVAGYGSSRRDSDVDEEETVVQSAVQSGSNLGDEEDQSTESRDGADQDGSSREGPEDSGSDQGNGQRVIQAFWFAVPEPREAVDATTGMPVFTIYPGDWFLGLEDHGSWFKVRDSDGREGLLRNIEGIQRG